MDYYDCSICGMLHPWDFNGDCRDDDNRYSHKDIDDEARVFTFEQREKADQGKFERS